MIFTNDFLYRTIPLSGVRITLDGKMTKKRRAPDIALSQRF
jgi:hypothetical protein